MTATLASGKVGKAYKATVKVTGTPTPTVTVTGLPKGLAYKNGTISGTPKAAGTSTVKITAKNAAGTVTKSIKLTIAAADKGWKRVAGDNRLITAQLVSQQAFAKGSCQWAVVANAFAFPDALAASALAGAHKGALILVWGTNNTLNAEAKAELKRLGVKNVYIMGGTGSVSAGVEKDIKAMGIKVKQRLAGANRVDTSVMALKAAKAAGSKADTVIVTTCMDYPDTLSISPWSYANAAPVVLTWTDGTLTKDAVAAIKAGGYKKAIVVSTNGAVAASADKQLKSAGVKTITRLEGKDAYATNGKVVAWELANGMTGEYPIVATYAKGFADALGGSALAGSKGSVIVLADDAKAAGISSLVSTKGQRIQGYFLGGPGSVSDSLAATIEKKTK